MDSTTMEAAGKWVRRFAKFSGAVKPPPEPYFVQCPGRPSRLIFAPDTHTLVARVAEVMAKRDQPNPGGLA